MHCPTYNPCSATTSHVVVLSQSTVPLVSYPTTKEECKGPRMHPEEDHKLVRRLEGMSSEEWQRIVDCLVLENRRLKGKFIALPEGASGEGGTELFSLVSSDRTSGTGSKLPQWIFRLAIMKHFFPAMVGKQWNRLPREVIGAPNL